MTGIMLITGTRKGIGYSLAQSYLEEGWQIVGCSRGVASIEHKNYTHFQLDVASEQDVVNMIRTVKKQSGSIDVLLNNAGMAAMNHILTTTYDKARSVFDTNFFGTFLFSREVGKQMMRNKKGCIINYSTIAVPLNLEGEAVYAASKAAIESFTKISAKELGRFGIRVNAIGPTPVQTDLVKQVPEEKINVLLDAQIIKRFGTAQDIKNTIDFLISDKSDFITGQVLYLGGVTQ